MTHNSSTFPQHNTSQYTAPALQSTKKWLGNVHYASMWLKGARTLTPLTRLILYVSYSNPLHSQHSIIHTFSSQNQSLPWQSSKNCSNFQQISYNSIYSESWINFALCKPWTWVFGDSNKNRTVDIPPNIKMSTMKELGSQNDQVKRCLDLFKTCILQLPVILQPSTRDSMGVYLNTQKYTRDFIQIHEMQWPSQPITMTW